MINSGLTRPKFSRKDDPLGFYTKQTQTILKMEKPYKPNNITIIYFLLIALLVGIVMAWLMMIVMWPAYAQKTMRAEEERIQKVILFSTNEADSWRDYVRGLIFDQYGKSTPWPEEPTPPDDD